MGAAEARARLPGAATRRSTRRRSAGGWSTRRCPSSGRSRSAQSAEKLAGIYGVTREAQDAFALRSHQLAARRGTRACSARSCRCPGVELERDESIRTDTSLEKLAKLKPAFVEGGTVTAGNSSPLNDGAEHAAARDEAARRPLGREPLARIVASGGARRSIPTSSGSRRSRRPTRRSRAPASAGTTSSSSSSTRRSPRNRSPYIAGWPELDPEKRQPPRRSDRDRPPARRIRGADPRAASPTSCTPAAAATASPRSASASARASPSSWRHRNR